MSDKPGPAPPLGQQIRTLRQKRGWTLAELARKAGTSAPTLHRYEHGWDRFEQETLRRVAAALDAHLEIRLLPKDAPGRSRAGPRARRWSSSLHRCSGIATWSSPTSSNTASGCCNAY